MADRHIRPGDGGLRCGSVFAAPQLPGGLLGRDRRQRRSGGYADTGASCPHRRPRGSGKPDPSAAIGRAPRTPARPPGDPGSTPGGMPGVPIRIVAGAGQDALSESGRLRGCGGRPQRDAGAPGRRLRDRDGGALARDRGVLHLPAPIGAGGPDQRPRESVSKAGSGAEDRYARRGGGLVAGRTGADWRGSAPVRDRRRNLSPRARYPAASRQRSPPSAFQA
ncbi:hypothetical protein RADP37_05481 (plasmid) [Roseomonas mucosa]|uniref:Uncharacterized protein n=1 Tax=Roseomonas mucosa TaxID=207340 RepID=A0A4Y1MRR4_9PROT|nr:hypothetical protein RADP37_05481 [Roseomonas mucosa]